MRRQQAILYQALTGPPPTAVQIPPSFGWFRLLEQPQRFRGGWRDWRYNAALAASGESSSPIKEIIPPTITADMWFAEWRLQPRYARDPRYDAVLAATSGQAPFAGLPISTPLGATRRALLSAGTFPTFWRGTA